MSTCRLCGEWRETTDTGPLVKYGVRHSAHAACAMRKWGAAFFDRLHPWQCANQFPYFYAKDAGCADALEARSKVAE